MSCPLNKAQLLAAIQKEYIVLEKFIAPADTQQLAFSVAIGALAVKDVLTHIYKCQ